MMSTSLALEALNKPTQEIIALEELLQAYEKETVLVMGRNLIDHNQSVASYLKELFRLGKNANNDLSNECKQALTRFNEFKAMLSASQRQKLNDTIITIYNDTNDIQTSKFSDLLNPDNKSECIFTTQIFIWQMVINSGKEITVVPELIQKLAQILLYRFKPSLSLDTFESGFPQLQQLSIAPFHPNASAMQLDKPAGRSYSLMIKNKRPARSLIGGSNHPYPRPTLPRS
jgi:hypothetical protein